MSAKDELIASAEYFPPIERHNLSNLIHATDTLEGQEIDVYYVPLSLYIRAIQYLEWAENRISELEKQPK